MHRIMHIVHQPPLPKRVSSIHAMQSIRIKPYVIER